MRTAQIVASALTRNQRGTIFALNISADQEERDVA
jgi:hypothetical protein